MSSGRFYQPIYLYGNSIINGSFQALGTAPTWIAAGQFYYDTSVGAPRFGNAGGGWDLIATDTAKFSGQASSYYLSRANHTGTQTVSTLSDFTSAVTAFRLDQFAQPTANIPMNGKTFTGLGTPTGAGQAATYDFVISQISAAISGGIKAVKDPVRVLIAANVSSLSGIPTTANADSVTLSANDRVILTGQSTGSQNGIWLVQSGAWTRPADWTSQTGFGYSGIEPGTEILVQEGQTYAGTVQRIVTTGALTVDTTAITFTQVNKINTYTAGNGLSLTGTVFAVTVVASGGITVSASGIAIDRTLVDYKYTQAFGDGSTTSFTITHNLNDQDVHVSIRDTGTNELVFPKVTVPTVNTITITFSGYVPTTNQFRVKVTG